MNHLVKYLIGYPGWDKPRTVNLITGEDSLTIDNLHGEKVTINGKDILDVSFDLQSKRSGTRAATGALVGGVLTGGVGLLAGAAIGAKAKDKSALTILFNEDGRERTMVFETKKQTNAIFNKIKDIVENANNPQKPATAPIKSAVTQSTKRVEPEKPDNKGLVGCIVATVVIGAIALISLFTCSNSSSNGYQAETTSFEQTSANDKFHEVKADDKITIAGIELTVFSKSASDFVFKTNKKLTQEEVKSVCSEINEDVYVAFFLGNDPKTGKDCYCYRIGGLIFYDDVEI